MGTDLKGTLSKLIITVLNINYVITHLWQIVDGAAEE